MLKSIKAKSKQKKTNAKNKKKKLAGYDYLMWYSEESAWRQAFYVTFAMLVFVSTGYFSGEYNTFQNQGFFLFFLCFFFY